MFSSFWSRNFVPKTHKPRSLLMNWSGTAISEDELAFSFLCSCLPKFQDFIFFSVSRVGWCWFPFLCLSFSIRAAYRSTVGTLVAGGCSGLSVGFDNSLSYSRLSVSLPSSGNLPVCGDLLLMQRHMRNRTIALLARWETCTVLVLQVFVLSLQRFCGEGIALYWLSSIFLRCVFSRLDYPRHGCRDLS